MPPKFSLQPVLDYRHNLVEALEVELGNLLAARQRGLSFLEKLHDYRQHLFRELTERQNGEMDLLMVNQLRLNVKLVEERIQQQINLLAELDGQITAKRSQVVSAKQDEETLITLKRRETERYQAELAQQEIRMQDDIYIAQAFRKATQIR